MKKSLLSIMTAAAVASGCFTMSTASGDMIFSTVGSEASYTAGGDWPIIFSDTSSLHSNWALAFTPADNYSLTSIEIGLAWNAGENNADVWLMNDDGGQPGSAIESFATSNLPSYSDVTQPGARVPLVQLDSQHHSILEAGTQYWVAASASTAPSWVSWVTTDSTPVDYTWARINHLDPSPSWSVVMGQNPGGLRINGDPVLTPLPGAVVLLGAGMVTSAGLLRRRRQ